MLNLGNLLQTTFITMGVASATPICDKQNNVLKADATTTNYSLNITKSNSQTAINYTTINDSGVLDSGRTEDIRVNLTAQNSFINVVGNDYYTKVMYGDQMLVRNDEFLNTLNTYNGYPSTQRVIILKITPYNYNIDTETTLIFQINFEDTDFDVNEQITINNFYFHRNVYATTQENWDQYIDKQLTSDITGEIIRDINDVNNNYYYTKITENIGNMVWNEQRMYADHVTLNIVPKIDNYFVISYTPILEASLENNNYPYTNVYVENGLFATGPYTITGTNIIPTSTYEVVDIAGLMWQILTMPFAFVSQAFNLTLFPGTPYQLNISNLFLSIIAVIIFIWLITFIIKMKG